MQAARVAVKDLREKGKQFVKPKYADSLLGSGLEEQIRRATAKALPGPDLALNRRIVETINADLNEYSAHQLASVLKTRLSLKNAHKQWLAIELVQEILEGCPKVIESAKGEVLEDVAQIAAQPMNRYGADLPGQQHCKNASFALLKKYGHEGQDAMRDAYNLPQMVRADSDDTPHLSRLGQSRKSLSSKSSTAGASSNSDNSFPAVRERVQMGIATSQSHSEVLQDMVLNLSSAEGKRDIEHEKKLLKDLVKEMVQFRNKFEQTLELLSQFETHEAQSLMTEALEAMDMMNNAIVLQNEVLTARKNTRQNSYGRSSSAGSSSNTAPTLAPPPGSASAVPASPYNPQTVQAAAPTQPPAPSYLDILSELQQAMERPTMGQASTAPQPNDPFAASYNNLFGSGSGPSSQPSGQQFMNHPTAPQSYADMPQYQQQQPAQSHNPFAAMGDQPSGSPSFASSGSTTASIEPGITRVTSTPPLASAASLAPQQSSQQPPQGMYQAHPHRDAYSDSYRGNFQGNYQQPNQGTYSHPNQGNGANGYQQSYQGYQHPYQPNAQSGPPQATSQPAFSHALSQTNPSSQLPQSSFRQQNFGPRTPNTSAEDPFAQIPYPELDKGAFLPNKPQRAPAPPLSSYSSASELAQRQEQQRLHEQQQRLQEQQQQREALQKKQAPVNAWAEAHPQGATAGDSLGFEDNAFGGTQHSLPVQQERKEAARPRNLYINSLYNEEPGAEGQMPAGFQPTQQGPGGWGASSPVTSPAKNGMYTGDSGPPTPEGLQYQQHNSAGSSLATTPAAQNAGNSEWDMFFADRIRGNSGASHAAPQPVAQQQAPQVADPFDELSSTRVR